MRVARKVRWVLGIALTVCVFASASAASITVATFADPAVDSSTPLFTLAGNQFSGGWTHTGLTLLTPGLPGPDVPNAKFTMPAVIATSIGPGVWTLTGGSISFTDASNTLVLMITFGAASLVENIGFGASDLALQNVVFSGPNVGPFTNERFAFSFANEASTANATTWTASFTSSGVPEPASLALLAATGLLCGSRRRRAP